MNLHETNVPLMREDRQRVVLGAGASKRVATEIAALGFERVAIVCTPSRKNDASAIFPGAACVVALAREHVPVEIVAEAKREIDRVNADAVLAFGGGSAIGLAKALAIETSVKVIAIPTTYSGSEMTPVFGTTSAGMKTTGRDERARPVLVIYDSDLTKNLPREVTIPSLWNALAHVLDALWSHPTPLEVTHAISLLARSARILALREDAGARLDALEGAHLAGRVFADVGGGLHHKLCHVIGGMFALPHASTHAVLLPHVARFKRDEAPDAMATIARALGAIDAVTALEALARDTNAPLSLEKLGMPREGIARVVAAMPDYDSNRLTETLMNAWSGSAARKNGKPLRGPETIATQSGFGSAHSSEALAGALPKTQNAPRRAPYGLYPELLSGTPFTVKNAENSRVWMYRVRPSFAHGAFTPLAPARFATPLGEVDPNRVRWNPLPIPEAPESVDFMDGLITLGGDGDLAHGPGYAVSLYAANADMIDRAFSSCDGDVLIVPQKGTIDCRTELGFLRVSPGSILLIPRAIKFAVGLPEGAARGWMLEVVGRTLRLPERGLVGSNGLADARHFLAPVASYEDRTCADGFQILQKLGGVVHVATQEHSPFDVVAWHGRHAPHAYDLSLFSAMGSVTFDHADPSILTVLTAPLDDHGRALVDFVAFPPRWEVIEHSFRPPFMHRNAASEINMVVRTGNPATSPGAYVDGQTFISPMLTSHGVTTAAYDAHLDRETEDPPHRIPDGSLWTMFESALPFRPTAWARETPLVDAHFGKLFEGMKKRFDPNKI